MSMYGNAPPETCGGARQHEKALECQPMTSELTKEIIVGCLAVLFTAFFAGIPGVALFWWTYQRDQERLIVENARPHGLAFKKKGLDQENVGPVYGIVIRNRSLFSVHVSNVGFEIDGEVIAAEHPNFVLKLKKNPDPKSNRPNIPDENADPREIPSQASVLVSLFNAEDRKRFTVAVWRAAKKRDISIESILYGPKMIAMVSTETGKLFTSLPPWKRAYRWLVRIKREMDGQPGSEDSE
jgi:hypothetical protein